MQKIRKMHLLMGLLLLGLIGLLFTVCGSSFAEFSSKEGKFAILMPGTPEKKTRNIKGVMYTAYGVSASNGVYSVGYSDLPGAGSYNLSTSVNGIAKAHGAKVLSDQACTFAGSAGRQFEAKITKPKGYVSGLVTIINGRYYGIMAVGESARLSNPDVQTYIRSFKRIK